MANLERLRSIEANAWTAYQEARRRVAAKVNAITTLAVIDAGERWERNADLHEALRKAEIEAAKREGRLPAEMRGVRLAA